MLKQSNRLLLAALVSATLWSGASSQNPAWPTWVNFDLSGKTFIAHPALSGLNEEYISTIHNQCDEVPHGNFRIHYHPSFGELAVETATQRFGTIPTGLRYVFGLRTITSSAPTARTPVAILVVGVKANGRAAVFHAPWDATVTQPSSVVFTQLIPDAAPGVVYSVADLVYDYLYLLDATAGLVVRFFDSNADGLPDTLDPIIPLALAPIPLRARVEAFYRTVDGRHAVLCPGSSNQLKKYFWIDDSTGAMVLKEATYGPMAPNVEKPHLRGHGAIAGLTTVRVEFTPGSKVWLESNGVEISTKVLIPDDDRWINIPLRTALKEGQMFVVRGQDGNGNDRTSSVYTTGPQRTILFQGAPHNASSGATVILDGGNFDPLTTRGLISLDHGVTFVPLSLAVVGTDRIVVLLPTISGPASALARIRVYDSTDPAATISVRQLWIDP